MKFQSTGSTSGGTKRVAEEEIIEVEDLAKRQFKPNASNDKSTVPPLNAFKKPQNNKPSSSGKSSLVNLVKRKVTNSTTSSTVTLPSKSNTESSASKVTAQTSTPVSQPSTNALSLLSGYDDSDSNESD